MKRALPPPVHQDTNTCATCGAVYFALLAPCRPWVCGRCIALAAEVHVPVADSVAPPRAVFPSPLLGLRGLVGALCMLLCSCIPPPPWYPTPTPTAPQVKPTVRATATPSPKPVQVRQLTAGHAVLEFSGLDAVPLTPTRDNLILATLTWETEGADRTVPVLELGIRGNSSAPCLSRSRGADCKGLAGLIPRYSSNLAYDSTLPWDLEHEADSQSKACGAGVNYHQRLALGPYGPGGTLRVEVLWGPSQITVRTPVDSWTLEPRVGWSIGLGRVVAGSPWSRSQSRGWLWDQFSAGAGVRVLGWDGTNTGGLISCP